MKNFISLTHEQEICTYIGNLWRSDIFKASHNDENGYIHCLVKKFSLIPHIFFDMHKERLEMVHFSSWFNAIQHRYHYTNDIIHDLYYHHELFHISTFSYNDRHSWGQWKEKMSQNEFWASLESEVLLYFYLPELRPFSFNKTLWVDRFLQDERCAALYGKYYHKMDEQAYNIKQYIANERRRCEFQPFDEIEQEISRYSLSSDNWATIWQQDNAWHIVETRMCEFLEDIKIDKRLALKKHLQWLEYQQAMNEDGVAFVKQAYDYSLVHQSLFQSAYNPIN